MIAVRFLVLVLLVLASRAIAAENKQLSLFQQAEAQEAKEPRYAGYDYAWFLPAYASRPTTASVGDYATSTETDPKTGRRLTELARERCAAFRKARPWIAGSVDELERRIRTILETGKIDRLAEVMSAEEFSELKGLVDDPGERRVPADLVAWLKQNTGPGVKLTVARERYRETFGCIAVLHINGSNGLLVTVQVCAMFGGVEWQTYRAFSPSDEPHMIVE